MRPPKFLSQAIPLLALLILLAGLSGCQFPFGPSPAATTSPAATGAAATGSPQVGIPPAVLTEVAATMYAPMQATWTAQAEVGPQAASPTTQLTQPAAPQAPTRLPTDTAMPTTPPPAAPTRAQPTATAVPTQAENATPVIAQPTAAQPVGAPTILPQPTYYLPANPPSDYIAQSGEAATIAGVNLPSCGGLTANFMVINNSGDTLESVSIQIEDLSTGSNIYGPVVSEAPFMLDDRVCAPGGWSHLESGYTLFTGAATNVRNLSSHTLQANFLFCSGNNLNGRCYSRTVEFVVP